MTEDPVVQEYYSLGKRSAPAGRRRTFEHLMNHSDCDGFYVPIDFEEVLLVENANEYRDGSLGMVGSSQQLLRECERLRDALGIPADLKVGSAALNHAFPASGQAIGWERYVWEVEMCLYLMHGARLSIEQGAVLSFG